MPASPNAAPAARRAAAQPSGRKKSLNLDKLKEHTSDPPAAQKIRRWQVEGGGVVPAEDDIVVVEYDDNKKGSKDDEPPALITVITDDGPGSGKEEGIRARSPVKATPTPNRDPTKARTSKEIDIEKKAWVRRRSKPQNELELELKHVGAPKKRVVSDGHWRRDHSPTKKEPATPATETKPYIIKRTVAAKEPITLDTEAKVVTPKRSIVKEPVTPNTDPIPRTVKKSASKEPATPETEPRPYTIRRSVTKEANGADKSPRSYTIKRSVADVGLKTSPSGDDGTRVRSFKPVPRERERSLERGATPPSGRDEIGARETPRRKRSRLKPENKENYERRHSGSDQSARHTDDEIERRERRRMRRRPRPSSPSPEPVLDEESVLTPGPDDSISRRNEPVGKRTRSPLRERLTSKPELRRRPSEAERQYQRDIKISPTPPPPPVTAPPQVFGNRIEAWLTGTADPFEEAPKSMAKSPRAVSPLAVDEENGAAEKKQKHQSQRRSGHGSRQHSDDEKVTPDNTKGRKPDMERVTSPEPLKASPKASPKVSPGISPAPVGNDDGIRVRPIVSPQVVEEDNASSVGSSVGPSPIDVPETSFSRHAPGANLRRMFPSTGKRLSTIASVDTLNSRAEPSILSAPSETSEHTIIADDSPTMQAVEQALIGEHRDGRSACGLRRKLTTHEDLMSVLSLPRGDGKSIMSARSIRSNRVRLETATIQDLMDELASDETKYQRELRTLVDGVIPVLLTCVLSKSDSAITAGLFGKSATNASAITQPIVDMGVALERLRSHHKRIPQKDAYALLAWAQGAIRVYTDYLKAWRMGFQDVVVNLAPADEGTQKNAAWDDGLPRNQDGDLLDADGERVDVAFLLKRPLIRLKYLAKTFKGINHLNPSTQATTMAEKYQELVTEARKRSNEERARLEDEAAASIDPTRARDPRSLALLAGVSVDAARCVRARDYFDMNLRHSTGQQLDCKVELLLRDNLPERGDGGDLLVCEVSDTGRWLLFPPIHQDMVSARNGNLKGEIIVMFRGRQPDGSEWHELVSFRSSEEQAGFEWVQMLGLSPVPPSLSRKPSFAASSILPPTSSLAENIHAPETISEITDSRVPSPTEVEVPIGEPAKPSSKRWSKEVSSNSLGNVPVLLPSGQPSSLHKKRASTEEMPRPYSMPNSPLRDSMTPDAYNFTDKQTAAQGSPILKRTKAKRYRTSPVSPTIPSSPRASQEPDDHREPQTKHIPRPMLDTRSESTWTATTGSTTSTTSTSTSKKEYSVWMPSSGLPSDESDVSEDEENHPTDRTPVRPQMARRTSSVPSLDLPTIPKLRKSSGPSTPTRDHYDDEYDRHSPEKQTPSSAPAKLQKRIPSDEKTPTREKRPSTLQKSPPSAYQPKKSAFASFTPAFLKRHRRSSSPLKHEYEPSTATDTSSQSASDYSDDESVTSESSNSDDEDPLGLKSPGLSSIKSPPLGQAPVFEKPTPPETEVSVTSNTISPSQSASQSPYRTVPQSNGMYSRTIATIFSWSDQGGWKSMHPREITVIISPGLIEAFETSIVQSHPLPSGQSDESSPSTCGIQPLVALELTPLVPLRRGTALDISIRSPPRVNSLIRTSSNIMFRSRNPEECEYLYNQINTARINNPTYIALQNARGPVEGNGSWGGGIERRNSSRRTGSSDSWWHLGRRSSYRSKGTRTRAPSIAGTESSIGTMNSAFSALRRFSGSNNRAFNISKSTVTSTTGDRTTRSSSNSESLSSGASTPMLGGMGGVDPRTMGTPVGITNTKIRLYHREREGKWRDMGSARLTIMIPPRANPNVPANPRTTGREKRVLVTGKTRGETLLDVTLGESCFERVARTGIAVSVWEDVGEQGRAAETGGVGGRIVRVYMVQMKSERDCAYTFGLVGKLRY